AKREPEDPGTPEERTVTICGLPPPWVVPQAESALNARIADLVKGAGELEVPCTLSKTLEGGFCVVARLKDRRAAQDVVDGLDGRDNRMLPRSAKWQPDYRPPTDAERFSVTIGDKSAPVADVPEVVAEPEPEAVSEGAVELSGLPADWQEPEVRELCAHYGALREVRAHGAPGAFAVAFATAEAAARASSALDGLQVPGDDGGLCDVCCARPAAQAAPREEPPLQLFMDELHSATGEPSAADREVYLRSVPVEDVTEDELQEWAQGFGELEGTHFLRDFAGERLAGYAYLRFTKHEDAAAMITAYPAAATGEEATGDVEARWSLSERLQQGSTGVLGADALGLLAGRLEDLRLATGCPSLSITGDGSQGREGLGLLGHRGGALRFAWLREDCAGPGRLVEHLAGAISAVLRGADALGALIADAAIEAGPEAAELDGGGVEEKKDKNKKKEKKKSNVDVVADARRRKKRRGADEDHENDAPQLLGPGVLVRGFPPSWTEKQIRLIFAVLGGVDTVTFTSREDSTHALVKLKPGREEDAQTQAQKAAEKLHNNVVGDGVLVEECRIMCDFVDANGGVVASPLPDPVDGHVGKQEAEADEAEDGAAGPARRRKHRRRAGEPRQPAGGVAEADDGGGGATSSRLQRRQRGAEGDLRGDIERGTALIREGRAMAVEGLRVEAYEKYVSGLQMLMGIRDQNHGVPDLQNRINRYVEEAERLQKAMEERLPDASASAASSPRPQARKRAVLAPPPPPAPPAARRRCAAASRSRSARRERRGGAAPGRPGRFASRAQLRPVAR
ncbi:unnamed protein product, partial [Prorocentrum cordatum]